MSRFTEAPIGGAGIGLRTKHYQDVLSGQGAQLQEVIENRPPVAWFEVLTDNYLGTGGLPRHHLHQVRENYPLTFHGVGMSLGSTDPLDYGYLTRLKALIEDFEPAWVSDHLAWVSVGGRYLHDLIPFPYTREVLDLFAQRIIEVQEFLGRRILVENPSTYLSFNNCEMSEWAFVKALVEQADCELLIDVNNIYVSAVNNGFDPLEYVRAIPAERVREIHLAGYEEMGQYLFDTHGYRVRPPVWELYRFVLDQLGPTPTLIEWDNDIPDFSVLLEEAAKAQAEIDRLEAAA
jgi:uncharacterized protein (UPF0276 family)